MRTTTFRPSRWSLLAFAAAVALTGCADETTSGPAEEPALSAYATAGRGVDLGECDELAVPGASKLVFHAYASGVQIYEWNGAAWVPRGPSAKLYADAAGTAKVGIHYGGPTWESNGGSLVVGRLRTPCERGTGDIPWLLLDVDRSGGPGVFHDVDLIQRVNTVGGRAPAAGGNPGEVVNVPYTAEYFFYRLP
jgi:hypothetical protein